MSLKLMEYESKDEKTKRELTDTLDARDEIEKELNIAVQRNTEQEHQLKSLQREKDRLKFSLNESVRKLTKETEDGSRAQRELRECHVIIEQLKNDNRALDSQIEELRAVKASIESELENIRSEYEVCNSKNDINEKNLQDSDIELKKYKDDVLRLENLTVDLEKEKSALEKDVQVTKAKCLEYESLVRRMAQTESDLKHELQSSNSKILALESETKLSKKQGNEFKRESEALGRKVRELDELFKKCDRERKEARQELILTQSKLADIEYKYDYECSERRSLSTQMEDANEQVSKALDKGLNLEQKVVEQKLLLDMVNKEVEERDEVIRQLKNSKVFVEGQRESLKQNVASGKDECERLQQEIGRLQREIFDQHKKTTELDSKLRKAIAEKEKIRDEGNKSNDDLLTLKTQLDEVQGVNDNLEYQLEEYKQSALKYKNDAITLQRQVTELTGQCEVYKETLDAREGSVGQLREAKRTLEEEMEQLQKSVKEKEGEKDLLITKRKELETSLRSALQQLSEAEEALKVYSNVELQNQIDNRDTLRVVYIMF